MTETFDLIDVVSDDSYKNLKPVIVGKVSVDIADEQLLNDIKNGVKLILPEIRKNLETGEISFTSFAVVINNMKNEDY